MSADPQVAAARQRADLARDRLLATVGELRERLSPATIARDLMEDTRAKAVVAADTAVEGVAARPGLALGAAALAGLLLVGRPLTRRWRREKPETGKRSAR